MAGGQYDCKDTAILFNSKIYYIIRIGNEVVSSNRTTCTKSKGSQSAAFTQFHINNYLNSVTLPWYLSVMPLVNVALII